MGERGFLLLGGSLWAITHHHLGPPSVPLLHSWLLSEENSCCPASPGKRTGPDGRPEPCAVRVHFGFAPRPEHWLGLGCVCMSCRCQARVWMVRSVVRAQGCVAEAAEQGEPGSGSWVSPSCVTHSKCLNCSVLQFLYWERRRKI